MIFPSVREQKTTIWVNLAFNTRLRSEYIIKEHNKMAHRLIYLGQVLN